MWNKAPAMAEAARARGIALPQLQTEEMADIVAYLYSVRYFAGPGDAGRGRELAASKGCLACHALAGRGGRTASDLARAKGLDSPAAVISVLWNHSFIMQERNGRRRISWPELRAEEMADLASFLQGSGRSR